MNIKKISLALLLALGVNGMSATFSNYKNTNKVMAQEKIQAKVLNEFSADYLEFSLKNNDKNQIQLTLNSDEIFSGDKILKINFPQKFFQSHKNEKFNGEIKFSINGNNILLDNVYLDGVYTFDILIERANKKQETYRISFEKIGSSNNFEANIVGDNSSIKILNPKIDGAEIKSGIFNLYSGYKGGIPVESLDFSVKKEFSTNNLSLGKTYYLGFKKDINSNEYFSKIPICILENNSSNSNQKYEVISPIVNVLDVKQDGSVEIEIKLSDKFSVNSSSFEEVKFGGSKEILFSQNNNGNSIKLTVKSPKKTFLNGHEGYEYNFKIKNQASPNQIISFEGFSTQNSLTSFLPKNKGWFTKSNDNEFLYHTDFLKNDYIADISSSNDFDKSINLTKPSDSVVKVNKFENENIYAIKIQLKGSNVWYTSTMKFKDTSTNGITSGNSTGNVNISTDKNNLKYGSCSMTLTLPNGFGQDATKKPVLVGLSYVDQKGNLIKEDSGNFSNVSSRFEGMNLIIEGLVPEKEYKEVFVNYTDKDGSVKTLVLKDIKVPSVTRLESYLNNFYKVVFARPADEAGYHFHLNQLKNREISLRKFLLNMLSEKEFIERYKTTESKVEALYNGIFFRTSDWEGKLFWIDEYKKAVQVYGSESKALYRTVDRIINEKELKELAEQMDVLW